jgi:aminoglycoside phosphotransferase (APT) family kinase protein
MDDVARQLLGCLQRTLEAPALAWAEPPVALTGGYDTAIYAFQLRGAAPEWSAPLILRVYRLETRVEVARFEAAIHGCLRELGARVPRVLLVVAGASELGRPFVVMERAPGRNLVAAIQSPSVLRVPGWLAATQAHLHGLPAGALESALAAAGFDPKERRGDAEIAESARAPEALGLEGLRAGAAWLAQSRPAAGAREVICHGDFHPLNLLADRGRVTALIDWPNVRIAEPEYDVGATLALLRAGPVEVPALLKPIASAGRRLLTAAYLSEYRRRRALDPERLRFYEALRLMRFLLEEGAEQQAELAGRERSSKRSPWQAGAVQVQIAERFAALTGVRVGLPSGPTRR